MIKFNKDGAIKGSVVGLAGAGAYSVAVVTGTAAGVAASVVATKVAVATVVCVGGGAMIGGFFQGFMDTWKKGQSK